VGNPLAPLRGARAQSRFAPRVDIACRRNEFDWPWAIDLLIVAARLGIQQAIHPSHIGSSGVNTL
jgi:hypothetical protein